MIYSLDYWVQNCIAKKTMYHITHTITKPKTQNYAGKGM